MKQTKLYIISAILILIGILTFSSCKKNTDSATIELTQKMIQDKTWFLTYRVTNGTVKSYLGEPSYFINFLKNKTTKDSDGLEGTYMIKIENNQLQVALQIKLPNQTSFDYQYDYQYDIDLIGESNLVFSYTPINTTDRIKLYFTLNK